MSTCRFIRFNLAESWTVLNGTAGSPTPPVRTESAPYVMERALNSDRRSLWRLGATNDTIFGGNYQLDLDAGSSTMVSALALHGLSCPGGEIQQVSFYSTVAYPTPLYSLIDSVATSGTVVRDAGIVFAPMAKRYWTIYIEATAPPIVGRVVAGQSYDLGLAPNPGSVSTPFRIRSVQPLQDGSLQLTELGYEGRDIQLNFDPVTTASRDLVLALRELPGSVTYFDPDGNCFEIAIDGITHTRYYNDVHGVSLQAKRLP